MKKIWQIIQRNLARFLPITGAMNLFHLCNSPNLIQSVLYKWALCAIIVTNIIGILTNENIIRSRIVRNAADVLSTLSIIVLLGLLLYYRDIPEDERYLTYILLVLLLLPDIIKVISFFRNKRNHQNHDNEIQ